MTEPENNLYPIPIWRVVVVTFGFAFVMAAVIGFLMATRPQFYNNMTTIEWAAIPASFAVGLALFRLGWPYPEGSE